MFIYACWKHRLYNGTNNLKALQWKTGLLFPPRGACDECTLAVAEHSQTQLGHRPQEKWRQWGVPPQSLCSVLTAFMLAFQRRKKGLQFSRLYLRNCPEKMGENRFCAALLSVSLFLGTQKSSMPHLPFWKQNASGEDVLNMCHTGNIALTQSGLGDHLIGNRRSWFLWAAGRRTPLKYHISQIQKYIRTVWFGLVNIHPLIEPKGKDGTSALIFFFFFLCWAFVTARRMDSSWDRFDAPAHYRFILPIYTDLLTATSNNCPSLRGAKHLIIQQNAPCHSCNHVILSAALFVLDPFLYTLRRKPISS